MRKTIKVNNNIIAVIMIICMIPGILSIGKALNGWLVYDARAPYVEQPTQVSNGTWIIALGAIILILAAALALTLSYYKLKKVHKHKESKVVELKSAPAKKTSKVVKTKHSESKIVTTAKKGIDEDKMSRCIVAIVAIVAIIAIIVMIC